MSVLEKIPEFRSEWIGGKENIVNMSVQNDEIYIFLKDCGQADLDSIKKNKEIAEVKMIRNRIVIKLQDSVKAEEKIMAKQNYDALAKTIIENVGGKENIESFRHCATRLRFKLKNMELPDTNQLKKTDGVMQVMTGMGEYQIVIGNTVADVYDAVAKCVGISPTILKEEKAEKKGALAVVMDYMSAIIMSTMVPFTACGVLKGLLAIATLCGVTSDNSFYVLFSAVADSIFYFIPIYLGLTTAKKVGMNPMLGMTIGASLVYPTISGVDLVFFGHTFNQSYTSQFLPAIFVVLLVSPLDKWLRKILPDVVKNIVSALVVLVVAMPVGYFIIGPITTMVSNGIADAVNVLYGFSPVIVGIFAGIAWQILVVFGVHHVLMMACFVNLLNGTGDLILAVSIIVAFAQTATVFAMFLRSKNVKFKSVALPAVFSGIFGVTEPAIYGITLPRIKYFVISCIGGAVSGMFCGLFGIRKYAFGSGVVAIPTLINPNAPQIVPIVIAIVAGVLTSFILTMIVFKDEDVA